MNTQLAQTLADYDTAALTLCSIGSHSALDVAYGARAQGFANMIVTEKRRARTYGEFYWRRESPIARGCVDATLELDAFAEILRRNR